MPASRSIRLDVDRLKGSHSKKFVFVDKKGNLINRLDRSKNDESEIVQSSQVVELVEEIVVEQQVQDLMPEPAVHVPVPVVDEQLPEEPVIEPLPEVKEEIVVDAVEPDTTIVANNEEVKLEQEPLAVDSKKRRGGKRKSNEQET